MWKEILAVFRLFQRKNILKPFAIGIGLSEDKSHLIVLVLFTMLKNPETLRIF